MEDSPYSELKASLSAIPVRELNCSSRLTLALYLDGTQDIPSVKRFARDYRGLAEQIGLKYQEIKKIQEFKDRTLEILDSWEKRPDAKLDKLITYLEYMERYDVIEEIIPLLKKDAAEYLDQRTARENPIQVAEVSSVQYCSSSSVNLALNKELLTTDDVRSGECTTYDAYVCYADEDTDIAKRFARILESPENGFKLCMPGRNILPGYPEVNTNIELIKFRCRRMIIILTPNFIESAAQDFQVSFASSLAIEQRQRILIPIIWTPCEIPSILSNVSKIDFTKEYTKNWMMDKLIASLMPEGRTSSLSTDKSYLRSHRNDTPISACSTSAENRPVITPTPSAIYSLSSPVQIISNTHSPSYADISDEERFPGACSETYQSTACSEMHEAVVFGEMHQSAVYGKMHQSAGGCFESKEILLPHKSTSKKFQPIKNILNKMKNSASSSFTSFSSGATSGYHSQTSSSIKSLEKPSNYTEDMEI